MTPEQRELFRKAILQVLDTNGSQFGMPLRAVRTFLEMFGFPNAEPKVITSELLYLEDKSLVTRVGKQISPENAAWRITALGRDLLATNEQ